MDLRCLKTFCCVAEQCSFTRAAERLGYSQSTVSFQIRQLEKELNVRLFDRINHTVTLTDQGHTVLQYAQQMEQLSLNLLESLHPSKEITGHIRLAMANSLCPVMLGNRYSSFRREYPGISLKIIPTETREMFRLLNQNEVDLVLTLDHHIYQAEYVIVSEERVHTHFIAAPSFRLAKKPTLSVRELLDQPFLLTERGMSYRRIMDDDLAERSLAINPVLETGDADLICRLISQGAGISLLPDYVTEKARQNGELVYLPVNDLKVEVWKQLLHHREKWVSPAMKAVIRYCTETL